MKYYIEIKLNSCEEIPLSLLWEKLFPQIHLALVSIKETENGEEKSPIGVSFPEYFMGEKFGVIGSKLRILSMDEEALKKLDIQKWLSRLSDYVHVSSIREVPQKINGYAVFSRCQPKVNKERLARRYSTRHNISYEEALKHYDNMDNKSVKEPFINLKSLGTNHEFCLWIKKTSVNQSVYQKFSTYGLSSISTTPEF